jgi:protein arginine N-methyltransferase 5
MTSSMLGADVDPISPQDDFTPTFYVGHHESKRPLPVTGAALRQAQDVGVISPISTFDTIAKNLQYDMLTSPITSPHFHSRVLTLISTYLSDLELFESSDDATSKNVPPAPIIPPLNPVDTPLTPGDTVSQLIAYSSPWIDLCSPDPLISSISRQVLNIEVAYASFCGIGNIIIPGPRSYSSGSTHSDGLIQYARAIQEALTIGSYIQVAIHIPMYGNEEKKEMIGDLRPFARDGYMTSEGDGEIDMYETWDAWNLIRSICKYSQRLSVGKNKYNPFSKHFSG